MKRVQFFFGGIRVKAVSGPVTKSISGGGHVTVG